MNFMPTVRFGGVVPQFAQSTNGPKPEDDKKDGDAPKSEDDKKDGDAPKKTEKEDNYVDPTARRNAWVRHQEGGQRGGDAPPWRIRTRG